MRETEFRGKDRTGAMNHDWFYGSLDLTTDSDFPKIICKDRFGNTMFIDADKETIGQYTERKDKNDKKIFDGDIINWYGELLVIKYGKYTRVEESNKFGESFRDVDTFGWFGERQGKYRKGQGIDLHIITSGENIGNIYDNPELLEEGEEDE